MGDPDGRFVVYDRQARRQLSCTGNDNLDTVLSQAGALRELEAEFAILRDTLGGALGDLQLDYDPERRAGFRIIAVDQAGERHYPMGTTRRQPHTLRTAINFATALLLMLADREGTNGFRPVAPPRPIAPRLASAPRHSVTCDHCGAQFEAIKMSARYCSSACRYRAANRRRQPAYVSGEMGA